LFVQLWSSTRYDTSIDVEKPSLSKFKWYASRVGNDTTRLRYYDRTSRVIPNLFSVRFRRKSQINVGVASAQTTVFRLRVNSECFPSDSNLLAQWRYRSECYSRVARTTFESDCGFALKEILESSNIIRSIIQIEKLLNTTIFSGKANFLT
jgi:hypothetical protein